MKTISITMKAEYRGHDITFNEFSETWALNVGDKQVYTNAHLEKVKEYVDKLIKNDFKPFKAILRSDGWGNQESYPEVMITSVDTEGDVWIKRADGNRSKVHKKELVAITPENLKFIEQIKRLVQTENNARDERHGYEKKLASPKL